MKLQYSLLILATLAFTANAFKVKLSTEDDLMKPNIIKITLENQMDIFMNKETVIGEWVAYFENSRLCKVQACKDGLQEISSLSKMFGNKMQFAHIDW